MRVAVIGVGHLGRHHARILGRLPGRELVGGRRYQSRAGRGDCRRVTATPRLRGLARSRRTRRCGDHRGADRSARRASRVPLLEQGIHVLVEKPMTSTVEEADRLLAAAARRGRRAGGRAHRAVQSGGRGRRGRTCSEPRFIEVHRLGTFPERSLDIDVVFDLMIHDLDLVLDSSASEVERIEAVGVPVLTPRIDIANVRLRFANGCIANLTASRISRDRVRKIRFFQRDSYVSIDYTRRKSRRSGWCRRPGQMPAIDGGKLDVAREEPLKRELEDFVGGDSRRAARPV